MTGGQNHAPDFLRGEIAHHPFDERSAVHRSHRFWQIAQQVFDARAKTAGEDDGGDVFGRDAHGCGQTFE